MTLSDLQKRNTLAIKLLSKQAKIDEVVQKESWVEWALTEEPKLLSPDLTDYPEKPPLYAIYSFARSAMP